MPSRQQAGWRVVSAEFETSAPSLRLCPEPDLPEVAIVGRSNVGKSSLVNAFARQRSLARVSRTPGRTQLLNFFRIRLRRGESTLELRLVDLPGYGHARLGKQARANMADLIESYVSHRPGLCGLVLLLDGRRSVDDRDLEVASMATDRELPTLLVITKADKLGKAELGHVASQVATAFDARPEDVLVTSAKDHVGLGDEGRGGGLARDLVTLVQAGRRGRT